MTPTYPLAAVRALALHTQGLADPMRRGARPDINDVYSAVERVGWVQIDTLQVVRRAHYLTLWSRLGTYDPDHLDTLLFDGGSTSPDNNRRLFEYWTHAACIIPLTQYPNLMPMMRRHKSVGAGWRRTWAQDPENSSYLNPSLPRSRSTAPRVLRTFARRGSSPAHGGTGMPRRSRWSTCTTSATWRYPTASTFQRIYDVRDRVLPDWVDRTEPTEHEALSHLLEISMKAFGVCAPVQVGDYFHMKRTESKPIIESLISDGVFVPVRATLSDRAEHDLLVHRDNLPLLDRAADGDLEPRRTTFLSPFDSLFWAKDRDASFWNFNQVLECYKREPDRIWGYFCLPILDRDRLVGRFDPKLERRTGVLRLKTLYLEPGVRPSNRLASSVARAMRDFMRFHEATDLVIEHSDPPEFGDRLMAAM